MTVANTVMDQDQADEILHENTKQLRYFFTGHNITNPLIVWRNGMVCLSYYQTPEKEAKDIRTIAKLAGKLIAVLGWSELQAKEKVEALTRLIKVESSDKVELQFYRGGNVETLSKLAESYGKDLRNFRSSSNPDSSCMNHERKHSLRHRDNDGSEIYPCMAYNHPSITLVIAIQDGEIVGRSITSTDTKRFYSVYTKCYDTKHAMEQAMFDAGFIQDGDALKDCYLTTILNNENMPLMPYLDGNYDHADFPADCDELSEGDAIAITYSTGYQCDHSTGTPDRYSVNRYICDECCTMVTEDNIYHTENHGELCDCCYNNVFVRAYNGRLWERIEIGTESLYQYDGEEYTAAGLDYHDLVLHDGEVYAASDVVFTDSGTYLLTDCETCCITGEQLPAADMLSVCGLHFTTAVCSGVLYDIDKLLAVRDFNYCNGEPTLQQAYSVLQEVVSEDFYSELEKDDADSIALRILSNMFARYDWECNNWPITQQLPLLAA